MVRDEEISRLVKYAESLNIRIVFKKHVRGGPGAIWEAYPDGTRCITIFTWARQSKTRIILNLLHELAHEKSYIMQNRKLDKATEMATSTDEASLTKEQRKLVYIAEKVDAQHRLDIAHELDLKISRKKIMIDIDLDIWLYKMWYLRGKYPNDKEFLKKKQELGIKYANSKY